ncbi:MAG: hypothetical protein AAGD88_02435 [Bacteroidota bacterium]
MTSCTHRNGKEETRRFSNQLNEDLFVYSVDYEWVFNPMGGKQVSTHSFFPGSIRYTMTGKLYSTKHTMKKPSYKRKRGSGIVYVYFKEKTDSILTFYNHNCKAITDWKVYKK